MIKTLNRYLLSLTLIIFCFVMVPTETWAEGLSNLNNIVIFAQQKTIINYERSQPSSIENPVVDPNFNVMRGQDTQTAKATYIVIGLLVAATLIPLATWWYFSK